MFITTDFDGGIDPPNSMSTFCQPRTQWLVTYTSGKEGASTKRGEAVKVGTGLKMRESRVTKCEVEFRESRVVGAVKTPS